MFIVLRCAGQITDEAKDLGVPGIKHWKLASFRSNISLRGQGQIAALKGCHKVVPDYFRLEGDVSKRLGLLDNLYDWQTKIKETTRKYYYTQPNF